jgi:hypothetical protein
MYLLYVQSSTSVKSLAKSVSEVSLKGSDSKADLVQDQSPRTVTGAQALLVTQPQLVGAWSHYSVQAVGRGLTWRCRTSGSQSRNVRGYLLSSLVGCRLHSAWLSQMICRAA